MSNSTAGRADPYWYEWTAGLLRVVEMMHPDSAMRSVSFQVEGVKGWDDVVVEQTDGKKTFVQVKHSRIEDETLTFGDLVGKGEETTSLLEELYGAWREMDGVRDPRAKFVIFSNRVIGKRSSKSETGVQRPSLTLFAAWLEVAVQQAGSMADFTPEPAWQDAWAEWLKQIEAGDDTERLAFLRALELHTNQGDLIGLEALALANLGELFQISPTQAQPLLQALDHALRRWTTGCERVTAEDAYSALALSPEPSELTPAPPPPAPFFKSRIEASSRLERLLLADTGETPVLFLSAEPGEGKTSVVSRLTNRRGGRPTDKPRRVALLLLRADHPREPLNRRGCGGKGPARSPVVCLAGPVEGWLEGTLA